MLRCCQCKMHVVREHVSSEVSLAILVLVVLYLLLLVLLLDRLVDWQDNQSVLSVCLLAAWVMYIFRLLASLPTLPKSMTICTGMWFGKHLYCLNTCSFVKSQWSCNKGYYMVIQIGCSVVERAKTHSRNNLKILLWNRSELMTASLESGNASIAAIFSLYLSNISVVPAVYQYSQYTSLQHLSPSVGEHFCCSRGLSSQPVYVTTTSPIFCRRSRLLFHQSEYTSL